MPSVSVIIGTYNHLPYLQLCLFSLERQTFRDFEVIIADDGSQPDVGEWLNSYHPPFAVTHLWHEDRGFRKCRILNKALLQAAADYLLFIDADCILSKQFLDGHWRQRERGGFLGGRRVLISSPYALKVSHAMIRKGYFDGVTLWGLYHTFFKDFRYYEEALWPLSFFRRNNSFSLMGCNFSLHKSDILSINGFDEEYETRGGGEDTDIAMRLRMAGCTMKSVRYRAIQFHLGHDTKENKSKSEMMFFEKKGNIQSIEDAKNIKSLLRFKTDTK